MSALISPDDVERVFLDCLFRDSEERVDPVLCHGVIMNAGFHAGRLHEHKPEIDAWLDALPDPFHVGRGDGWSFLNACNDRNDAQWTGMHQRVELLVLLGIGIGRVDYCLPHEHWSALPGGMPYFQIKART